MQRAVVLALVLALAGCLQPGGGSPTPSPADADDGVTTLHVTVLDKGTGAGLSGTQVTLLVAGKGSIRKTTDGEGNATFAIQPAAACSLSVERAGFRSAAASVDCGKDGNYRLTLTSASDASSPSTDKLRPARPPSGLDLPGNVLLQGSVLDAADAEPIAGVRVQLDAPDGPSQRTGLDGAYAFLAAPGDHRLTVSAACWTGVEVPVEVTGDLVFDIQLSSNTVPPAAPAGVRATAGPGPGMVTISWDDAPGAAGFELLRGGQRLVTLGHSLAYGVPGASAADRFSVASRDACGHAGAASAEVSSAPLAGPEPMAPAVDRPNVDVGEESYQAFAPDGSPLEPRRWRTVTGTGNCCENYLTTTPAGRILDQGGSTLAYSDDEGKSWTGVISPLIVLAGEGSVAAAPDGDIVAFDWATYNADTAFAYRFSAATGTWQTAQVPVKAPAYDRPWIATIKGPFYVNDLVIPYVSVVEGGVGLKDPLLVSFDGLHYVPSNSLTTLGEAGVDLAVILTAPDSNRDWIHPMQEFGIVPVDNGIGIMERQAAMQDSPTWGPVTLPQIPGEILRVDSQGALHSVSLGDSIEYSISHDGGIHWKRTTVKLPSGWSAGEWDFKANAEQDQAVLAVNADVGNNVQQAAFRFRGLDGVPVLTEVLYVGSGSGVFGSGVAEQGNRFDFMTLGFLPDGRIVMSAADAEHSNPFLAIELPADGA